MFAIQRNLLNYLDLWRSRKNRKPLILRGARQVGKSWLVRAFAKAHFANLAELNLEEDPRDAELIAGPASPRDALRLLSARLKTEIVPGKTLLFIDEIQKSPEALAALRFWYEKLPELHVIAAGSLLDMVLHRANFSMPVGRIEYCYLGPLGFGEFLRAIGEPELQKLLEEYQLESLWPETIHARLNRCLNDFCVIGGMPEAVAQYRASGSYARTEESKRSIVSTYRDDFGKYGKRVDTDLLRQVYGVVPTLVGQRAKYVAFSRHASAKNVAAALQLLCDARVISRIRNTPGTGIPLGATADDKKAKYIFVDIGLQLSLCDVDPIDLERADDLVLVNRGALAEQFIGQHLLYLREPSHDPELYYWERDEKNAAAEIDYLTTVGGKVIPIEVKAGAPGRMKSLHLFCEARKCELAVRFYGGLPRRDALPGGTQLLSLPLYMVEQLPRLAREGTRVSRQWEK